MKRNLQTGFSQPKEAETAAKANAVCEMFTSHMDGIFYEGYTEQLAKDYPDQYQIEFDQFLNTYSHAE